MLFVSILILLGTVQIAQRKPLETPCIHMPYYA